MTKTTTSTSKYSRHIQPFIDLVESEKLRTSKEVKALVNHVKWCFDNEDIYVNDELADKYLGLSKYFPFEEVFPWQEFVITLHDCITPGVSTRLSTPGTKKAIR